MSEKSVAFYRHKLDQLAQSGRAKERVALALEAVKVDPWAFSDLASGYFDLEKYDLALKAIEEMREHYPEEAWCWAFTGRIFLQTDQHSKAVAAYERAIQLSDNWWEYTGGYLTALYCAGDLKKYKKLLQELVQAPVSQFPFERVELIFLEVAKRFAFDDSWEDLKHWATKFLEHMPANCYVHAYLALSMSETGMKSEAEEAFLRALKISSRDSWILGKYLEFMRSVGRYDEGSTYLKNLFQLDPTSEVVFGQIVEHAKHGGSEAYWGDFLRKHAGTFADNPSIMGEIAETWKRYGAQKEALEAARHVAAQPGAHFDDLFSAAMNMAHFGAVEEGNRLVDSILEKIDGQFIYLSQLIWYYVAAGDLEKVIKYCRQLLKGAPDRNGDRYILYAALTMSGKRAEALKVRAVLEQSLARQFSQYTYLALIQMYFLDQDSEAIKIAMKKVKDKSSPVLRLSQFILDFLADKKLSLKDVLDLPYIDDGSCLQLGLLGLTALRQNQPDLARKIANRQQIRSDLKVMCSFKCCLITNEFYRQYQKNLASA